MIEVTSPFLANSKSDLFVEGDSSWKATPTDDKAYEAQNLFERLDLASFPTKTGGITSGPYGKSYVCQENLSAFMADTKIAYEGEDGSKFFIHFSYKAISRKVRYELIQDVKWIWDSPETHPHPLDENFGPKATANRILSFARGLVNKFRAMEGEDKEKLAAFMRKLIKAIDKGFREAGMALGPISQDIGMMVHETYDLVMKGMALLNAEPSDAKVASQSRLIYEEEISYTSASMEISIMV